MSKEFEDAKIFSLDEGFGGKLNVMLTFSAEDFTKPLFVSFSDPDRNQIISIPADLWGRVIKAVERNWEQ